jgi:cell division protein FtsB
MFASVCTPCSPLHCQTHELQQKLAAATAVEGELRAALDEAAAAADALRGEVAGLKEQIVGMEAVVAKARKDVDFYQQGERVRERVAGLPAG